MSKWHGGKGSTPRPVDRKKFESNWDAIFGKKDNKVDENIEELLNIEENPLDVYNDARLSTLQDEKAWEDVKEEK